MDPVKRDETIPAASEEQTITFDEVMAGLGEKSDETLYVTDKNTNICTFPEGYKPRQAIYSCLTCAVSPRFAAICVGCAVNCHDGHKLIPLHTKRRLCCDCGNSRTPNNKCTLYEDKPAENVRNLYGQNFEAYFCVQKCTWDPEDPNSESMIQCIVCEDWYHFSHLELGASVSTLSDNPPDGDLICTLCVRQYKWFRELLNTEGQFCISTYNKTCADENTATNKWIFSSTPETWREKLCKCKECLAYLEDSGLDYLLDENDLLSKYEEEIEFDKTQENLDGSWSELATEIADGKGPDAMVAAIRNLNVFKEEFTKFFVECHERNEVVTVDTVHSFANNLKRRQQEERERLNAEVAKRARLNDAHFVAEDYDEDGDKRD